MNGDLSLKAVHTLGPGTFIMCGQAQPDSCENVDNVMVIVSRMPQLPTHIGTCETVRGGIYKQTLIMVFVVNAMFTTTAYGDGGSYELMMLR